MTTEVIIINRMGVVMATDSAVTVSGPEGNKVYDTGEKLFELDCRSPIGIMVNGNMHFLGIPWELIVKEFRDKGGDEVYGPEVAATRRPATDEADGEDDRPPPYESIEDAFHKFVASILPPPSHDPKMDGEAEYVRERTAEEMRAILNPLPVLGKATQKKIEEALAEKAEQRIKFYEASRAEFEVPVTAGDVLARHGNTIDKTIAAQLDSPEVSSELRAVFRRLIVAALLSKERSKHLVTGLAVAGYTQNDMFPSLVIADVDGAICGQLRFVVVRAYSVNRHEFHAEVISLAQQDVVERLLSGADDRFIKWGGDFLSQRLEEVRKKLRPTLQRHGMKRKELDELLESLGEDILNEWREKAPAAQKDFRSTFLDMIALMPKRDMIELAEALVNITAVERKATPGQSTVGGPIDVALITRHEEFLWIKRKFFFEARYNPRYYARKFGLSVQTGEAQ